MADEKYNGWTNYETWNVKLWIDNDEGSYNYWRDVAISTFRLAEKDKPFTRRERASLDLAEQLKSEHEENTPTTTGCYADLLNSALSSVNWYEIAESLIEDYCKDEPEQEDEVRGAL
jgi:hypothetical protein